MKGPHNTVLLAAIPLFAGPDDKPRGYVVALDRGTDIHDRYVVAWMRTLDDDTWSHGDYLGNDVRRAMSVLLVRSNVVDLCEVAGHDIRYLARG